MSRGTGAMLATVHDVLQLASWTVIVLDEPEFRISSSSIVFDAGQ